MKELFSYIRPHLMYFLFAYVVVVLSSGAILAFGQGMRGMVDSGLLNDSAVMKPLVAILLLVLIMSMTSFLRIWLTNRGSERVIRDLRKALYDKIVCLSPSMLETISTSSVMTKLIADASILQGILNSGLSFVLRNITILVGSVVMLAHTNLQLTMYATFVVPVILAVVALFGRRVKSLSLLLRDRLEDLAHFGEETCAGIQVIQSFVREERVKEKFSDLLDKTLCISDKYTSWRAMLVTLIIASVTGSIGIVLWYGMREVAAHNISAGALFSFIFYSTLAAGAVNGIGDNLQDLQKAVRISEGFSLLLNLGPGIAQVEGCREVSQLKQSIVLNDVTLYYPSKPDVPALRNVSFSIEKGEKVALIGPSGSGKSTFVNMLLRFYEINSGSITVDGIDIRNISLDSLRSLFCLVPQRPVMFSGTVLENIAYGVDHYTDEQLRSAAEKACIGDFIEQLPDGYNTFIGERGVCLSEGQRQRIVIARAILRDPEVLILDEATSALDSANESMIHKAVDELMREKSMIIVAHRLSTVTEADKIIVFNNGMVEERGTHESLMRNKDSLYSKLVKMQFYTTGS